MSIVFIQRLLKYFGLPKSLYFNFKYFPVKTALKLPVLLSPYVRLKCVKGKVEIHGDIRRGLIMFGFDGVSISSIKEHSIWNVNGTVIFKGTATLGAGTKIAVGESAKLTFGNNIIITAKSEIACFKEIEFGHDCLLSWNILVMDTDAHTLKIGGKVNTNQKIVFGNNVWVGCRTSIFKGSTIDDNCVVASNSLLNKKYDKKNCLIAGNPATIIKQNIHWERRMPE